MITELRLRHFCLQSPLRMFKFISHANWRNLTTRSSVAEWTSHKHRIANR